MVAVWGVAAEHTADTEAQSTAFSSFALLNRYVVPRAPRVLDLDISWRARRYLAVMGLSIKSQTHFTRMVGTRPLVLPYQFAI